MLSGTSMSSPFLAGCTAVLKSYLEANNISMNGKTDPHFVRLLLTNGAFPYREQETELCCSPRQQGAGMVSLNHAAQTRVVMNGQEGEGKINLRDGLGQTFSFPVTLTNFSNEDVQ